MGSWILYTPIQLVRLLRLVIAFFKNQYLFLDPYVRHCVQLTSPFPLLLELCRSRYSVNQPNLHLLPTGPGLTVPCSISHSQSRLHPLLWLSQSLARERAFSHCFSWNNTVSSMTSSFCSILHFYCL